MGVAEAALDGVAVHLATLEGLEPSADLRLRALLARARVDLAHTVRQWEGSDGTHKSHRVTLTLDAESLARVYLDPFLRDGVERAMSRAMSRWPRDFIDDIDFVWSGVVSWRDDPYRGSVAEHGGLTDALRAWLRVEGEISAVEVVSESGRTVTLRGETDTVRRGRIELAVRALRGRELGVRWAR